MAGARGASGCLFSMYVATTHPSLISVTPDIHTAMPVKASENQAGQIISNNYTSLLEAKSNLPLSQSFLWFGYVTT